MVVEIEFEEPPLERSGGAFFKANHPSSIFQSSIGVRCAGGKAKGSDRGVAEVAEERGEILEEGMWGLAFGFNREWTRMDANFEGQ